MFSNFDLIDEVYISLIREGMSDDSKFDGVLMSLIQQKGNIDGFFDGVFGFLRRNTDFFANQQKAEEIIVNNCKIHFEKYSKQTKDKVQEEQKKKEDAEKKRKVREEKQKQQKEQLLKKAQEAATAGQSAPAEVMKPAEATPGQTGDSKKEDDNEPAPKGNGGQTDKYLWTQTLQNLEMYIYLDNDVTKKNMKVTIGLDKLVVIVNGVTLIDGKWKDKINVEETYWTIETGEVEEYKGKYLHINLQKWKNQSSWWSSAIAGDVEINTQKINPEPSKLGDLDGETRSTVEKMMFDMRQKQQNLPSSDELQKQDKLKEFMKGHPEMDFSQCKFN